MRADLVLSGGTLAEPSDDTGNVTYTYLLNGVISEPTHTIQLSSQWLAHSSGPVRFGPSLFFLTRGTQGSAPEAFIDNVTASEIVGLPSPRGASTLVTRCEKTSPLYALDFGFAGQGNSSSAGYGMRQHLHPEAVIPRLFQPGGSQTDGMYTLAYKNHTPSSELISHHYPIDLPTAGTPLYGGGNFDGTALWLANTLFQASSSNPPAPDTGVPPIHSASPPAKGTRWDGVLAPAEFGVDVRVDDKYLIAIDVPPNQTTRRSFVGSAHVYVPTHAGASYNLNVQPYIVRAGNGLTVPGGTGHRSLDFSAARDSWNLVEVRADIVLSGGTLPASSDDTGTVTYTYALNGVVNPPAQTLQLSSQGLGNSSAPVTFGPNVYLLTRGTQGSAPEVFIDNVKASEILLASATCEAECSCTDGACPETCTTNADCTGGKVCGTDNGAYFGRPAAEDICWLPTCCTNQQPPNSSGTILSQCGTCPIGTCSNGVKDAGESDVDCGGTCAPCGAGKQCNDDCAPTLVCGRNNGAYFGLARSKRVCWPQGPCGDGVDSSECGTPSSVCGNYCGGIPCTPPDAPNSVCPLGEVCKEGVGQSFGVNAPGVCVDLSCPSNDPAKCGAADSLCGAQCRCTPNCSSATAANPADGCNGVCPHLCPLGGQCCSTDLNCPVDSFCQAQPTGAGICRPKSCANQRLAPPLCGSASSPCGAQCPACTLQCPAGRQCGVVVDGECSVSCGTCAEGQFCDGGGQCQAATSSDPPIRVLSGTANPIDLPNLPEASTTPVGAVAGRFGVSDEGSAQYNIPIDVPPGRAGIEPVLSLRYTGAKSSGEAGVGWKLEGLSQILRCPRSYALDGYSAPIRSDETDRFCLDGKRLEVTPGSAVYGQHGAEYRTLIDSFNKVRSWKDSGNSFQLTPWPNVPLATPAAQGPDYFEVWTKDGRKLTYGRTRDAVLIARNGGRIAWLLNRVEDRSGNSMVIEYNNFATQLPPQMADKAGSLIEPRAIFYTGHAARGGDREVRFDYGFRPDQSLSYAQGGVPVVNARRLTRITTLVRGTAVKHYRLKYDPGPASLVTEIRECFHDAPDTDDSPCKPPTVFDYVKESGFTDRNLNFGSEVNDVGQLDMNGDGLPDFLITTAHVGPKPQLGLAGKVGYIVVDIGLFALSRAQPAVGLPATGLWTLIKEPLRGELAGSPTITFTGDVLQGTGMRHAPVNRLSNISGLPCQSSHSIFLDYDQDGKDDIVGSCSPYSVFFARSVGNGNFETPRDLTTWQYPDLGAYSRPWPMLYDVDGDGLHDVVTCYNKSKLEVRLRRNASDALGDPIALPAASPSQRLPYCGDGVPTALAMDVDGDGTAELLVRYQPQDTDKITSYLETGWYALRYSTSSPQLRWERVAFPDVGDSATGRGMQGVDLNGDGLMDFWRPGNDQGDTNADIATIWLNTGSGFIASTIHRPVPARATDPQARLAHWAFADHDADGRVDILEHWAHDPAQANLVDKNVVLRPNAALDEIEALLPDDLRAHWTSDPAASRYTMVGDLDADGNPDLFGSSGTAYYGSGVRNMLLSKVTDGLGNTVHVSYEALSGDSSEPGRPTYKATCAENQQWPVRCIKNMRGLVSHHSEGFVDANAGYGEIIERTYQYNYENGRIDVAGHGWLGFDKRIVTEGRRTVTVDFEPARRFKPDGTETPGATFPYLYPLVGLPRVTTIDQGMFPLTDLQSTIEDGPHSRRTQSAKTWNVQMSAHGRPFPVLQLTTTSTFSRAAPFIGNIPFDHNGVLRTRCRDMNLVVDGYGNVESNVKRCETPNDDGNSELERLQTQTSYSLDPGSWLISNPHTATITSTRGGASQVQSLVWGYYPDGLLESVTRDPAGKAQRTLYTRDPLGFGNVVGVTEQTSDEPVRTTTITYDIDHYFPRSITNRVGNLDLTTQFSFEPEFGQLATMADPSGVSVQYAFDAFGKRRGVIGATGTTTIDYAALPLQSVETPAGTVHPRLEVTIDSRSPSNQFAGYSVRRLDNYGRAVQTATVGFDGADLLSEVSFDDRGRVASATAPHLPGAPVIPSESYTYDYLDRVTRIENADGSFSERQYASGVSLAPAHQNTWLAGLTCATPLKEHCAVDVVLNTGTHHANETGKQSVTIRDHAGLILRTIDGEHVNDGSASSNYEYGPFSRLRKMFDNAGTATGFTYDSYGRLLQHADPDGGTTIYTYNGFGELKTSSRNGSRVYGYDTLGRLTSIEDDDGMTSWIYDQGVSALGQLSETISPPSAEAPNGQHVKYQYEPMTQQQRRGLLRSMEYILDDASYTVGVHYDDQARLDHVAYPTIGGGTPIIAQYHYQPHSGALESVTEDGSGVERPIWHLEEAFEGQLPREVTFGNGAVTTFGYDSARRWLDFASTSLGEDVVQDLVFDHYSDGQLLDRREPNRSQEYFYDPLGRLQSLTLRASGVPETQHAFGYDAHGNLTQNDAVTNTFDNPDAPHLPRLVGGNTYTHYPNGNLLSRTGGNVPGGTQNFTYTPFDLPRTITDGTPQHNTRFDYTADEQRVVRRDANTTRYQVGGLYERLTSTSSGATLEQRFRISAGGSVVAEIVRSNGADHTLFFHPDHLGTPETISDNGGNVTKQDYAPFGARQGSPPTLAGIGTRVGFTSQDQDDDLGLVDMHGRIFDPLAGRFTTADPIMQAPFFSQGQNRYAYVLNDPINLTDPSGMAFDTSGDVFAQGHIVGDSMTYGAVGIVGSIFTQGLVGQFGAAAVGSAAGSGLGAANLVKDILTLVTPDAATGGGSYNAPSPTAAARSGMSRSNATNAFNNARGGPPVQERAAQSAGAPSWSAGTVDPNEPLADPSVQRALGRAWTESNSSSNCFQSQASCPPTKEQGGWILKSPNGKYEIQRWSDAGATHKGIDVPRQVIAPRNYRLAGSFHTHPNLGPDWEPSASPADWRIFGNRASPHYIVSGQGTYRLTNIQQCLGSSCPTTNIWPYLGGGALAVGVGVGIYAYVESRD